MDLHVEAPNESTRETRHSWQHELRQYVSVIVIVFSPTQGQDGQLTGGSAGVCGIKRATEIPGLLSKNYLSMPFYSPQTSLIILQ